MASTPSSPTQDPGAGLTEVLLNAGGRQFRTVQAGAGSPTVIFESGMSASASEWIAVQRMVAASTATLSYDRAGYGGSDVSTQDRTLANITADLEAMLDAAGVTGPLVLVGHSWGGPILRTFVTTTKREVAGLVIVDGTISAVMGPKDARRAEIGFTLMSKLARIGLQKFLLGKLLRNTSSGLEEADRVLIERDMTRPKDGRAAAAEARGLIYEGPRLAALEALEIPAGVPVTFLMGRNPDRGGAAQRQTFLDATEEEAKRRGARFVVGEQSSHFVPQQEPQLVADEILALVGR